MRQNTPNKAAKPLISIVVAARILGISPTQARRWAADGLLPEPAFTTVGGQARYRRVDIERLVGRLPAPAARPTTKRRTAVSS